jgi:hypothetical protein
MKLYYHLLDPPTLTINNEKGTFGCGFFRDTFEHLSCSHATECRIKKGYLTFPDTTGLVSFTNIEVGERVDRFYKGWTQLRWSGLVQCRDEDSSKGVTFEYFTALNYKRCKKFTEMNYLDLK